MTHASLAFATEADRVSQQVFLLVKQRRAPIDDSSMSDARMEEAPPSADPKMFAESEYRSFAESFPMLIRTCGLAQATAWADTKGKVPDQYLHDLADVLGLTKVALVADSRKWLLTAEIFQTRQALKAADYLKRWAEALLRTRDQIRNARTVNSEDQT